MNRLQRFLASEEFYGLMQTYRHASIIGQEKVVSAFNEVREAILQAAGKNHFVITSVGYNMQNEAVSYTLQPVYGLDKLNRQFDIPVRALGSEVLKPGTRITVEIQDGER